MNTATRTFGKTNTGSPVGAFLLAGGKPFAGKFAWLTATAVLAAALSEYVTASEPATVTAPEPPTLRVPQVPAVAAPESPAVAGQETMTLAEAIRIALANNPELAAERYDVDAAGAERDIAAGARLPEVHLEGGYNFYLHDRLIKPRRPGTYEVLSFTDELLHGDFVLRMPLYTGGRLRNQVIAAELITRARWERLLHGRAELVFNVSSVFYAMLGQREVINSLIFSQRALEQHHRKTQQLLQAQKAAKVDLLRTEVRLADIEQQLLGERNVLAIQSFLLASLLGLERGRRAPEIEGELVLAEVSANLDQSLATAFESRQDYQSLRSKVLAQQKQVQIAKGRRLPQVSLLASYGDNWATDSRRHNEVGEIGMLLDVPLFEGGRIQAGIRRELSRLGAQQEALRQLELQIELEVETAVSNIESTRARVRATEKAVEQARESLRIEREKYDLGKGAIVDVLDAQSALLDSQKNYYGALADYNTALAEFSLAVGERQ